MSYFKCGQVFVTDNSNISIKDATGAVASFNTLLASPLVSLKAGFIATQEAGTPTPSEPKAINGVSSIRVTRCHKNIYYYDENKVESGTTTTSTTRAYYPLGVRNVTLTFSAKLKEGATKSGSDYLNIGSYIRSSGLLLLQTSFITPDAITSRTLTFSSDNMAVLMSLENPVVIKSILSRYDIQVEVSSSATTYEAYNGEAITIALGGTYYGGYIQKDASGSKLVLTYEKKKFSDITNWYKGNLNTAGTGRQWYMDLNSNPTYDSANNSLCNSFYKSGASWGALGLYEYYSTTRYFICVIEDNYNDKAEMLASYGNVEVTLLLKTPIELPLTDIPDITTFVGDNNIFNDSENTEVTYTASPFVIGTASGSIANFTTPYTKPLISLQASALATKVYQRGANLWDGDWEVGTYNTNTGNKEKSSTRIRSKDLIPIAPNSTIYFTQIGTGVGISFLFYDKNGTFKNGYYRANTTGGFSYTTQSDWHFLAISPGDAYGTTYNNDIAVRFDNSFDYVAYNPNSNEYVIAELGNITTLSGVNNIFADSGDIVECKYWGANT